jgi:hypothetical protein
MTGVSSLTHLSYVLFFFFFKLLVLQNPRLRKDVEETEAYFGKGSVKVLIHPAHAPSHTHTRTHARAASVQPELAHSHRRGLMPVLP